MIGGVEFTGIGPDASGVASPGLSSANLPFSGQRLILLAALEKKDRVLAVMYKGGLHVLADTSNPDRFSLCAHAMRELMEKLPRTLGSFTKSEGTLKAKVQEIRSRVLKLTRKKAAKLSNLTGTVDKDIRELFVKLEHFLEWDEKYKPTVRTEVLATLERLDESGRTLPARLSDLNVSAWTEFRDYFQSIAHHLKDAVPAEFADYLDSLERFLLDRLVPRTFDDFDEIDSLLAQDASHAQP